MKTYNMDRIEQVVKSGRNLNAATENMFKRKDLMYALRDNEGNVTRLIIEIDRIVKVAE